MVWEKPESPFKCPFSLFRFTRLSKDSGIRENIADSDFVFVGYLVQERFWCSVSAVLSGDLPLNHLRCTHVFPSNRRTLRPARRTTVLGGFVLNICREGTEL